jgi:ribulose-phosphate 3-epimerase
VLHLADIVLVMSVNPGFGGQRFLPEAPEKVRALRVLCAKKDLSPLIAVDGGIAPDTIGLVSASGAHAFVAGTAIFGHHDYGTAIAALRDRATAP